MDYSDRIDAIFENLRDSKGYVIIEESDLYKYTTEELDDLLDQMGEYSRKERGMAHALTSSVKFTKNQVIYIKTIANTVVGFVKIQRMKKLFSPDEFGIMVEHKATAVIDFFIHNKFGMQGHGKLMLNHILSSEYHPNGQVAFYKINKTFTSFLNKSLSGKSTLKKLDEDYVLINVPQERIVAQPIPAASPRIIQSGSQTNLSVLNSSNKMSSRGNIFNNAGRDLITQSTTDLTKLKDKEPLNSSKRMNFDEYLVEYDRIKKAKREKSPGEHRSKYFNDVFSSNVNFSTSKNIVPKYTNNTSPYAVPGQYKSEQTPLVQNTESEKIRDTYVPDIPKEFRQHVNQKDLFKPKGRFKNWRPVVRDLESSYDVKGIDFSEAKVVSVYSHQLF